jgi:hypothetical protein
VANLLARVHRSHRRLRPFFCVLGVLSGKKSSAARNNALKEDYPFGQETNMKNQRNVHSRDAAPRTQPSLLGEATIEPRHSAETGIVKLEKRRTPSRPAWWEEDLNDWLVWRGGW